MSDNKNYFPNMRKIKNKDVFKLGGLIAKNSKVLRPYLSKLTEEGADSMEIGLDAITEIAPSLGKEAYTLMLDVAGLSKEEFEDLPFDSITVLYERVLEENDLQAFFDGATKLARTSLTKDSTQATSPIISMTPSQAATDGQSEI